jgi:alpha-L-fucosidase 2
MATETFSMLNRLLIILCIPVVIVACQSDSDNAIVPDELLWYNNPADNWMQALPVGNGRLGAMVYGDTLNERIQLNEDSMWAGAADWGDAHGGPDDLKEIRKLLKEDRNHLVDSIIVEKFSFKSVLRSHQTMGDLYIDYDRQGAVSEYKRSLSLNEAIATTSYSIDGYPFIQKVFSSAPDDVLVIYLSTAHPDGIHCTLRLDRPQDKGHPTVTVNAVSDRSLSMEGMVTQYGGKKFSEPYPIDYGVQFETLLNVHKSGGEVNSVSDKLELSGVNEAILLLSGKTSFYHDNFKEENRKVISKVENYSIDQLQDRHIAEYQKYYNRVTLEIEGEKFDSLSTLSRLQQIRNDSVSDNHLAATLFQFGRYLLISSSRPGTNPANLQGLWNNHIEAPWNADYHVNINLQMNYWPANVTDLDEMNQPLFDFTERVLERGKSTARKQYGTERGAMFHHTTDLWATPWMRAATAYWGSWIHGAGWIAQHFWEHYRFTGDEQFLKERTYPFLHEVASFYLDWLIMDSRTGKWMSSPETSPENSFYANDGRPAAVSQGSAMGHQIIREVFENYLETKRILEIEDEISIEIREKLKDLTPGVKIGPDGRILEWPEPYDEPEKGHRHMSHLYALHPGDEITSESHGAFKAAQKTIDYRLKHGGAGTGWSRAWMINFNARLLDGVSAQQNIDKFFGISTADNLFCEHPPFQIDGNFGYTAGVAELLVQSHEGFIRLLPALPLNWAEGKVTGLKARGNIKVDIEWKDHALISVALQSTQDVTIKIKSGQLSKEVNLKMNKKIYLNHDLETI